jgi:hypothetical protein
MKVALKKGKKEIRSSGVEEKTPTPTERFRSKTSKHPPPIHPPHTNYGIMFRLKHQSPEKNHSAPFFFFSFAIVQPPSPFSLLVFVFLLR